MIMWPINQKNKHQLKNFMDNIEGVCTKCCVCVICTMWPLWMVFARESDTGIMPHLIDAPLKVCLSWQLSWHSASVCWGICFPAGSGDPVGEKNIAGSTGVKTDYGEQKQATQPTILAFSSPLYTYTHTSRFLIYFCLLSPSHCMEKHCPLERILLFSSKTALLVVI